MTNEFNFKDAVKALRAGKNLSAKKMTASKLSNRLYEMLYFQSAVFNPPYLDGGCLVCST